MSGGGGQAEKGGIHNNYELTKPKGSADMMFLYKLGNKPFSNIDVDDFHSYIERIQRGYDPLHSHH